MSVSVETSEGAASIPGDITVPDRQQYLAQRTLAARPSEVRKVFRAAQRPGMISFANGAPTLAHSRSTVEFFHSRFPAYL